MSRMLPKLLVFILLTGLATSFVLAQDSPEPAATEEPQPAVTEEAEETTTNAIDPSSIVADGLNGPRNIFYDTDGTLYVTEAGTGGDIDAQGPYDAVKAGQTGQISAIAPDGTKSVAVDNLLSIDQGFGRVDGVTSVVVTADSYWLTLGTGTQEPIADGALSEAVVQIDRATGEVLQTIDIRAFELANNPDTTQETISNPSDLALAADGTLYIVDASGNSLFTWTQETGLNLFAAWPVDDSMPQSVPTSVAIAPDGDIYIGFLSGFPFPARGARIERYNPDGTLKASYEGLTLVTDILISADGTLYAVQMANGFGDAGYNPNSGSVVKVGKDSYVETIADGLNIPYGIAQNAAGQLVVTVDSANAAPDSGKVIYVEGT